MSIGDKWDRFGESVLEPIAPVVVPFGLAALVLLVVRWVFF